MCVEVVIPVGWHRGFLGRLGSGPSAVVDSLDRRRAAETAETVHWAFAGTLSYRFQVRCLERQHKKMCQLVLGVE